MVGQKRAKKGRGPSQAKISSHTGTAATGTTAAASRRADERTAMDVCNMQLLKTVQHELDAFFAQKLQNNGTWSSGVEEEELQDLVEFARALYITTRSKQRPSTLFHR